MPNVRKFKRKGRRGYVPRPVKNYVRNALKKNMETKQFILSPNTFVGDVTSGANLNYNMIQIQQGDDVSERVGNLIMVTGFYARFICTVADTTNVIRFYMWQRRGDNLSTGINLDVGDAHDQDKVALFFDKFVTLSTTGPAVKVITLKHKFKKPKYIRYSGGTTSDYVTPPLFLSLVSDSAAASHPTINGNFRLYYKDV